MQSLAIIVLTFNEEIHIERCLRSALNLSNNIFVIDSCSTDRTQEIARNLGATIIEKKWLGTQSAQIDWFLTQSQILSNWTLRLDADEIMDDELINNVKNVVRLNNPLIGGYYMNRGHIFLNKKILHGGVYPVRLLRLWRTGNARTNGRIMDEQMVLDSGEISEITSGNFWDHNLKGLSYWILKHNQYAKREALHSIVNKNSIIHSYSKLKYIYNNCPVRFRSILYFIYRYILRLGFLDGYQGFAWHFLQGFWYRLLVDLYIEEINFYSINKDISIEAAADYICKDIKTQIIN